MTHASITLLPKDAEMPLEKVLSVPSRDRLFACDFPVTGAEEWTQKSWGYERGRVINIDHHADTAFMRRQVSSANLAMEYVHQNGIATADDVLVLNHTDCDSILAAAILRGDLAPEVQFGAAAIAADHTGDANPLADLLQALEDQRDYEYSLRQLRAHLVGEPLDGVAVALLESRLAERDEAKRLVEAGAFVRQNGVAWMQGKTRISGEMFTPLLPDAVLIAFFYPHPHQPAKWACKMRLGQAAPATFPLQDVVRAVDSNFGGRWNAGSNSRGAGSALSPQQYVEQLVEKMGELGYRM